MRRPVSDQTCYSPHRVTAGLLLSSLFLPAVAQYPQQQALLADTRTVETVSRGDERQKFTLRSVFHHGVQSYPTLQLHKDIHPSTDVHLLHQDGSKEPMPDLYISSRPTTMQRLKDRRPSTVDAIVKARRIGGDDVQVLDSAWITEKTPGPNVTDPATVLALAYMTYDAYYFNESSPEWEDAGKGYNRSLDVGWQSTGLRGHVFTNDDNSSVVLALKGTTPAYWDSIDDTTSNDKQNDNLFGSCCCAQQGPPGALWRQVCDCATSTYTCNATCLRTELYSENRYYTASRHLYANITAIYPNSSIWVVGHSLGGLVSSLIGQTYGVPAVTFEAVPDALASTRLGLPKPPSDDSSLTGTFHFGHTADPVYMGTCGSAASTCSLVGYAFEAQCHTGRRCTYDTVKDKNIGRHIWYHPVVWVINNILKVYETVPECEIVEDCIDCYKWKYYESHNDTGPPRTTTSTSTQMRTRTRTETCRTPGWWGCLDSSTSMSATSTSEISTTSSHSCTSKGWFGCLDPTTTALPITTTLTSDSTTVTYTSTTTSICKTPGWFGRCDDVVTTPPTTTQQLIPSETGSVHQQFASDDNGQAARTQPPAMTAAPYYR